MRLQATVKVDRLIERQATDPYRSRVGFGVSVEIGYLTLRSSKTRNTRKLAREQRPHPEVPEILVIMNFLQTGAAATLPFKSDSGNIRGPLVRILVVDDFAPFRQHTIATLNGQAGFQVVGEATDGLEAMQQLEVLKPDLVVLDIALPKLNGIETAKRIRQMSDCKILFLTGNPYPEVMQEAFGAGANGYLAKVDVAGELQPALQAVLSGKKYVSRKLSERS